METLTIRQREQRELLANLDTAEKALRRNLHMHGLDAAARAHMERALSHVHEGYIAVNEPGRARTVDQLQEDLTKAERLTQTLAARAHRSNSHHHTTG